MPQQPSNQCSYAKVTVTAFEVLPSRSCAIRSFEEARVLGQFGGHVTAVGLSGYLFFGRWALRVLRGLR